MKSSNYFSITANTTQYNLYRLKLWAMQLNITICSKKVDIEHLTLETLDAIIREDWEKWVKNAENIQELDNQKKTLKDALLEPIMLTILHDNSNWSDNEESGIEQFE